MNATDLHRAPATASSAVPGAHPSTDPSTDRRARVHAAARLRAAELRREAIAAFAESVGAALGRGFATAADGLRAVRHRAAARRAGHRPLTFPRQEGAHCR